MPHHPLCQTDQGFLPGPFVEVRRQRHRRPEVRRADQGFLPGPIVEVATQATGTPATATDQGFLPGPFVEVT